MKLLSPIIALILLLVILPANVIAATLNLSPSSGTFNVGCSFSLDIKLDTQGVQTDGTDAIVLYDSSRFTATNVTEGTIYPDYQGTNIDDSKGVVTTSGLASISTPFTGQGTLATVVFTVKANASTGAAAVSFDFDPNNKTKTTDSNVVQRGGSVADVLSAVTNGSYTIGTGACTSSGATTGTTTGTTGTGATLAPGKTIPASPAGQPYVPTKELPPAGTKELTYTIAIVGSVLTVLGILGLALL